MNFAQNKKKRVFESKSSFVDSFFLCVDDNEIRFCEWNLMYLTIDVNVKKWNIILKNSLKIDKFFEKFVFFDRDIALRRDFWKNEIIDFNVFLYFVYFKCYIERVEIFVRKLSFRKFFINDLSSEKNCQRHNQKTISQFVIYRSQNRIIKDKNFFENCVRFFWNIVFNVFHDVVDFDYYSIFNVLKLLFEKQFNESKMNIYCVSQQNSNFTLSEIWINDNNFVCIKIIIFEFICV